MADYDGKYWKRQVDLSKKELENFHTAGEQIIKAFLSENTIGQSIDVGIGATKVNMFWANIGILKSALYGNPPKPLARREFEDPNDDVGRVAATIMERLLVTGPNGSGKDMHECFQQVVEDRLLPGMGQMWLRYESQTEDADISGIPYKKILNETVCADYVHWKDFFYSPARTWGEVWWCGRRVWMEKDVGEKRFGASKWKDVKMIVPKDGKPVQPGANEENSALLRGEVFEIYCKKTRKVYWYGVGADQCLDEKNDLLQRPDFWPCPKPLMATTTTTKFIARGDYTMCQDQYRQLEQLNIRIGFLVDACKAIGVYDKTCEGVQNMFNKGAENKLVPVDNWAMFAEKGGLKGVIDWMPIDAISATIERLREARVDCVQQIYELTGISDIMRGVTNARETYGAQQLKAQYSSSRLQLYQLQVGAFVAEAMEIKAWIISKHFQPETIIRKSLVMYTEDKQYAEQAVQLIKQSFQLMYRINVSSTQMSIPDYNAEKQARTEYITSLGQFVSQITGLVQLAPEAAPYFLRMLQWAGAAFQTNGGVETIFDNFVRAVEKRLAEPPKPPQPSPDVVAKLQADTQMTQLEEQTKVKLAELENQTKMAIAQLQEQTKKELAGMEAGANGRSAVAQDMEDRARELNDVHEKRALAEEKHRMGVQKIVDNALLDVKNILQEFQNKVNGMIVKAKPGEEGAEPQVDLRGIMEASIGVRTQVSQIVKDIEQAGADASV